MLVSELGQGQIARKSSELEPKALLNGTPWCFTCLAVEHVAGRTDCRQEFVLRSQQAPQMLVVTGKEQSGQIVSPLLRQQVAQHGVHFVHKELLCDG